MSRGTDFYNRLPMTLDSLPGSVWDWMVDHPKKVLEALVSVGALKQDSDAFNPFWYLPEPHIHEWRVNYIDEVHSYVFLRCDCGFKTKVPNRLPIEAP